MSKQQAKRDLMGGTPAVADGYLFTRVGWSKYVGVNTRLLTLLPVFMVRGAAGPATHAALKVEGQLK